jgi:predicted DCC family thiol-disulfide oxidoreductase YuxK
MEAAHPLQPPSQAWIFYDGDCPLCRGGAEYAETFLRQHGFLLLPLQTPGVTDRLGLPHEELMRELKLLTADGRILGGAEAMLEIARKVWWTWPLRILAGLPGGGSLLRWLYARVAANRYCLSNACSLNRRHTNVPRAALPADNTRRRVVTAAGWWPLVFLPGIAFLARPLFPAWVFMWLLAGALFAACKWLTLQEARAAGETFSKKRALGYLLGWVGMDPSTFASWPKAPSRPRRAEWIAASWVTLMGLLLLWVGARLLFNVSALAAGWMGMVGLILALHFGSLRLLALAWRRLGVPVDPLMRAPWRSGSVAEFWGRRWNTGFHRLAHRFLFLPALASSSKRNERCRNAPSKAWPTLFVFLVSGLIHDLVITVPAGGGYGLPTAYFLFQGCALIFERSPFGRWLGLGRGARGHLFALLVTAGPAFWLFPPVFVNNIILPMLQAIGAL